MSVGLCLCGYGQQDPAAGKAWSAGPTHGAWGDQGNGTYANPVMPADTSDLDAIRVGAVYYAITSTFQYSPGMAVLASSDLVNWHIAGHVVGDLNRISPAMNWDRMDRAGRGIWAGAIRYHAGKYWVYFGTPDEGIFMSTAANPAGPWTPPTLVLAAAGWDDPCPFWDDDGQGYLVTTHFQVEPANGKAYNIHLFKLSGDGRALLPGFDRVIHQSKGSEANKLYKIDGRYYHYYSEVRTEGRVAMMERAKSLAGPWEAKQLNHVDAAVDKEPNQGGLVELPSGEWFFLTHQGTGDWEGRAGVLLPVTWVDGWPILGRVGQDGIGNMVWRGRKPIVGFLLTSVAASDDFTSATLRPEWEWNYQPRAGMWSLTERPGFLRLRAFAPLRSGNFHSVGDVLTQRAMRGARNSVTVKVDVSGMVSGQQAGLAQYAKSYATFGVVQAGAVRRLAEDNNGRVEAGPVVQQGMLWLRSTWGFDGVSRFAYSQDGERFTTFGTAYQLSWGDYRGDRVGLFTFRNGGQGGYVDVDAFQYASSRDR